MNKDSRSKLITIVLTAVITAVAMSGFLYWRFGSAFRSSLVLMEVMDKVEREALWEKTPNQLLEGAIQGTIDTLDDPFTYYMNPKVYKEILISTRGTFGGVGIEMGVNNNGEVVVVSPMEGTPAYEAGIKPGDIIKEVDGKGIIGLTLEEVANLIRGPENTEVELGIQREGKKELLRFKLNRTKIELHSVYSEMLDDDIGYLRLVRFTGNSAEDVRKAIADLQAQGMKGMILDLRYNPGGLLNAAVDIAQEFVPKGPVVSVHFRNAEPYTYSSNLEKLRFPLVVLINEGSASASEILSGAIQDTKAGTIVGTRSFGKGLVQTVYELSNGGGLALTTAEYKTPKGRSIHGIGIEPDVKVAEDECSEADVQLEKAKEILKQKIAKWEE